jgi:hypothetical protein
MTCLSDLGSVMPQGQAGPEHDRVHLASAKNERKFFAAPKNVMVRR